MVYAQVRTKIMQIPVKLYLDMLGAPSKFANIYIDWLKLVQRFSNSSGTFRIVSFWGVVGLSLSFLFLCLYSVCYFKVNVFFCHVSSVIRTVLRFHFKQRELFLLFSQ